ncbi:MAG: hypothetical protein JW839_20855 [Candidatus Lokiarchaeota archaeon]|nr:hypothetical protein [Candidatus Lokiarchaeota archaeon]
MQAHHTSKRRSLYSTTVTSAFALLFLAILPCCVQPATAAGQCVDDTDDIYVYSPNLYDATSCYKTSDHSSNDISLISWANDSGDYVFNFTFEANVNLLSVDVLLYFFANGTYSSGGEVPPYQAEYSFFVHLNVTNTRVCYNLTNQRGITPVVHGGNVAEVRLLSADTHILSHIPNMLPMEQWFCVGLSAIVVDGGLGYDYINWPLRFNNDQLWLPADMSWVYWVVFGAIALGVVIVVAIVLIKRRKTSGPSKGSKDQK